jgi:hypothetical protein
MATGNAAGSTAWVRRAGKRRRRNVLAFFWRFRSHPSTRALGQRAGMSPEQRLPKVLVNSAVVRDDKHDRPQRFLLQGRAKNVFATNHLSERV